MTGKSRVLPALWKQCGYLTYTSASDNYRALNSVISMTKWLFWSYLIRKTCKIRNIHRFRRFYSQNIRRHNAMCRDELVAEVIENIWMKLDFQSIYFYIDYTHVRIGFIIKWIQYINASLLNLMSRIHLYLIEKVYSAIRFSIHCVNTSGLKQLLDWVE